MTFIRVPKSWEIPEREVTSEATYFNRRRFLKTLAGASILPILGCQASEDADNELEATLNVPKLESIKTNPAFAEVDRPITNELLAGRYNNYYEF
ncbi:MAG TPA: protein-methionine-sulfoxide reductase catalytic subunit MsrP, partial [Cyanobacteria bacterium UBA11148]|nr:protein-methionine-sulfoxide reductase catalytic subunit MsrP [Cyanobacteria bacterium UBA11148]